MEIRGGGQAHAPQAPAQQRERVAAQRQPEAGIVGDHVLSLRRGGEAGQEFGERRRPQEAGQDLGAGRHPVGVAAMAGERGKSARGGKIAPIALAELRAPCEILNASKGCCGARGDDALGAGLRQAL